MRHLAAAGLLVLTVAAALDSFAPSRPWHVLSIALAWTVVLAGALVARTRRDDAAPARPALASSPSAQGRTPSSFFDATDLVRFAQELHGTLESDRLHALIARRLAAFVRRREVWVVARFGTRQHIIVPPGAGGAPPMLLTDDVRQWVTFPMKVKGEGVGVLGVGLQRGDLSGGERRVLAIVADLVAQALATVHAFELLREATVVDSLTGCATRAEGLRRFEAELRRADRTRTSLAVLMLDLDHFKTVNDRFGHHTGDAVLTAIGELLLKTLRASDVRCRWGGEEFLIVLTDTSSDRARRACDALRQRIETTLVRTGAHAVHVTGSIGVTMTNPGETDIPRLLTRADAALYRAKNEGRNRVEFVPDDPPENVVPAGPVAVENPGPRFERRNPSRPDRRRVPSAGRRRTDPGFAEQQQPA